MELLKWILFLFGKKATCFTCWHGRLPQKLYMASLCDPAPCLVENHTAKLSFASLIASLFTLADAMTSNRWPEDVIWIAGLCTDRTGHWRYWTSRLIPPIFEPQSRWWSLHYIQAIIILKMFHEDVPRMLATIFIGMTNDKSWDYRFHVSYATDLWDRFVDMSTGTFREFVAARPSRLYNFL